MKLQPWSKYDANEKVGIVLVSLLILGSTAAIAQSYDRKVRIKWADVPVIGMDAGGKVVYWSPQPLAEQLARNLQGFNVFTYPETVRQINALRTEQVKLLWNYYNKYLVGSVQRNLLSRFILNEGRTLTSQIESEWTDWGGDYDRAVSKFKSIGLY